jgi:hypothetical protein
MELYADNTVYINNYATGGNSLRAPIFYDSNNTGYYLDPNAGTSLRIAGAIVGDHAGWTGEQNKIQWHSGHMYFQNTSDQRFVFRNSNGAEPFQLYAAGYGEASGSWRAPIFYDSINPAYYLDANGSSFLNLVRVNNWLYLDQNFGHSIVGAYSSTIFQGVFAMGDAYKLTAGGGINNLYGICWSHPNAGGIAGNLNTHGALITENGSFLAALSGSIRCRDNMQAPLYYDSNNTGYYTDPASTCRVNVINCGDVYNDLGGWFRNYGVTGIYNQSYGNHFYADSGTYWNVGSNGNGFGIRLRHSYASTIAGYYYGDYSNNSGLLNQNGSWKVRVNGSDTEVYDILYWNDGRGYIFRDRDNTGYYSDPNGSSNLNRPTSDTSERWRSPWRALDDGNYRPNITGDSNYWTNTQGWGTNYGNWDNAWRYGHCGIDIWGGGTGHPQGGGYIHAQGIQSGLHYATSDGGAAYGWQMCGATNATENRYWARGKWGGSTSGWKEFAMYGGTAAAGDLYANVFRDANDSGYYIDPAYNGFNLRQGDVTLNTDASGYHCINPEGVGGNIRLGAAWGVIGIYNNPHISLMSEGNVYFRTQNVERGYMDSGSNFFAYGSSRAPIFYDNNNTSYYCNPESYSQFSAGQFNSYVSVARIDFIGVGGNSGQGVNAYNIFQEGGGWGYPYPDLRIAYHTGLKLGANAGSYEGTRVYSDYDMSDLCIQLAGSSNYSFKYKWMYTNTTGFYSDTNGWHIHPNDLSSYGGTAIRGNRNGWWGIHMYGAGYTPHMMWESGNGGFYLQDLGRWAQYYSVGNNCTGFCTSSTSSSYGIYVAKGIYSEGNIVAYSDARSKTNVKTIENSLSKVLNLRGVTYNKLDRITGETVIGLETGVIAQEVNKIFPEVVTYAEDIDEYGVSYGNFAGLFIEAMKEQNEIINTLKLEVEKLKLRLGD